MTLHCNGAIARNKDLYNVWQTMMRRCYDPNRPKYKIYGARGIKVDPIWHNANTFLDWAEAHGWRKGLQIDRIDNNGDYSPENCRIVTPKQNSRNRRNTVWLTINGEKKSVAEWCETIQVSAFTIYWWVREKGIDYAEKRIQEII